jgi:hypothetical protein
MPRKSNDSCMFCEPEAPCPAHQPKAKKKAASRGPSRKAASAPTVPTMKPALPEPTVQQSSSSGPSSETLKAAMKAAAETAPTSVILSNPLPRTRQKQTGEMSLITLDPIQTSPAHSQPASLAHLDARASMKESALSIEDQKNSDHEELLTAIAVLEPILHPESIKPYRAALWRRRNLDSTS